MLADFVRLTGELKMADLGSVQVTENIHPAVSW
jgi:hypothetical protein